METYNHVLLRRKNMNTYLLKKVGKLAAKVGVKIILGIGVDVAVYFTSKKIIKEVEKDMGYDEGQFIEIGA